MENTITPMQQAMYQSYFKKYLNDIKQPQMIVYFVQRAWQGWLANVKDPEIEIMEALVSEYEKALNENPTEVQRLVNEITSAFYENRKFSNISVSTLVDKQEGNNSLSEGELNGLFDYYHSLFENEFRLWSVLLYWRVKASAKEEVNISAGEKYQVIKNCSIKSNNVDLSSIAKYFDNHFRNASSGHKSWKITDENKVEMYSRDPKTGGIKKRFLLTKKQIKEEVHKIERGVWILDIAFHIFFNKNNKSLSLKAYDNLTTRELEAYIKSECMQFQLEINKLVFSDDRSNLEIEISNTKSFTSLSQGEIYTDKGLLGVTLPKEMEVPYKINVFGVLQRILMLNGNKSFTAEVTVKDVDDKLVCKCKYPAIEISRLESKSNGFPIPSEGSMTEESYKIVFEYFQKI